MKKLMLTAAGLMGSVAAFAEGTASSGTAYSGSEAESIVSGVSTTMTNFLTGAAPTITTIIVAGLSIWAGIALVGILKKSFSVGKGR